MKQLTKNKKLNFRGYNSESNRNRAIAQLKRFGYNYFIRYVDTQSEFALNFGKVDWLQSGAVYYG